MLAGIALIAGFGLALLAAGIHSLFFVLLPILAFIFGYFSPWRRGLLYGFLLFTGYNFAISVIWYGFDSPNLLYPTPYIAAFIFGGFSILLIGALASLVKKGVRKFGSIAAFAVLVAMIGWCGYNALPHYGYYNQVVIHSQENLENIELYLPIATVDGKPYDELYEHVYKAPGHLTQDFTQEFVETEYGRMLKITIPHLEATGVPMPAYEANIIFWEKNEPHKVIQLEPRTAVEAVNTITSRVTRGPVTSSKCVIVERFNVPVKIVSDTPGPIKLTLWNRTDRSQAVNFAYTRSYPYVELIDFGGSEYEGYNFTTADKWIMVPVEDTVVTNIRGFGD